MGWPGPMTHLQFLAWNAWLTMDLECPSRADMYVMQLTHEVASVPSHFWGKDYQLPLEKYRLRTKEPDDPFKSNGKSSKPSHAALIEEPAEQPMTPALSSTPSSSQEQAAGPTLPPMVTRDNKAAIVAKIATSFKLAQAKLRLSETYPASLQTSKPPTVPQPTAKLEHPDV